MARDDGKRYGAGGALIETVEPQVEDAPTPKKRKATNKDAALATNTKNSRSVPQESESSDYLKESVVQKMSSTQYEKNQDAIMEAIRTGKFIYDVSGNAR